MERVKDCKQVAKNLLNFNFFALKYRLWQREKVVKNFNELGLVFIYLLGKQVRMNPYEA